MYFFFNDTATPEIYTLSLHDALPISAGVLRFRPRVGVPPGRVRWRTGQPAGLAGRRGGVVAERLTHQLIEPPVEVGVAELGRGPLDGAALGVGELVVGRGRGDVVGGGRGGGR